jgi:hypothetical protein
VVAFVGVIGDAHPVAGADLPDGLLVPGPVLDVSLLARGARTLRLVELRQRCPADLERVNLKRRLADLEIR